MTTTKNNEHKKLNFSSEREQSQTCLNSAEHEKNQGRKVLNVPNLRFPEFQGEWEKQKLCDISSIVGRIGFRGYTTNDIVEKGMGAIALSPTNIVNNQLTYDKDNTYISMPKYDESPEIMIKQGDVIFVKTGSTVGKVAYVDKLICKTTLNPQVVVLKDIKCDNYILSVIMSTRKFQNKIQRITVGGAVPTLSQVAMGNIFISLPTAKEQEKISKFISLIDKRIATQNKIIDKLLSLIKGISSKIFASIKGVEYRMGDIATITNGNSNVQDAITEAKDGLYPFFDRSEDIKYLPTFLFDKEAIIYPGEGADFMPRYFKGKFALHQRCYAIFDFNEIINAQFLYFYLRTKNSYFIRNAVGSTVPSLRLDTFQKLKVVIPSKNTQHSVSLCLSCIEQKCYLENEILQTLLKQKQFLLRQMFI